MAGSNICGIVKHICLTAHNTQSGREFVGVYGCCYVMLLLIIIIDGARCRCWWILAAAHSGTCSSFRSICIVFCWLMVLVIRQDHKVMVVPPPCVQHVHASVLTAVTTYIYRKWQCLCSSASCAAAHQVRIYYICICVPTDRQWRTSALSLQNSSRTSASRSARTTVLFNCPQIVVVPSLYTDACKLGLSE